MFVLYDKKRKETIRLKKRLLSILLAAVMLLSALPLGLVDTAEAAAASSGQCGDDIRWVLDDRGTLTITGTGAMYDYDYIGERNPAPWCANGLNNRVRTVVVKKGITELGYDVFAACRELRKVTLPSGLKRIGAEAFLGCYNLPELTIPATVTSIEWNAFTRCDSIKTLTLPGGLKEIGDAACAEMEGLSSVTLGKGITYLSENMFAMCPKLTSVTVPEGVSDIGSCAFRDCENLQTLRLPASLKTVGEAASSGTSIADVYFAGTAAQWNALRMDPGNNHIRCAKVHYRNAAAVPAAPKIKLTTSGNQFQLSWNAVPGAASYQVYRIVDSTVEDYTLLGTTKSTTYTDKTAKVGTTYTFAVKAVNANGESMTSSSCAGKLAAVPANVTLGAAKAVTGGIQVTWQKAANAATYNVYRIGPGDTSWKVVSAKQSGTSYTDKNVTAGNTYKYTVRGVAADGKTLSPGFNNTGVSATMPKPAVPANVTLTGAKAVTGGIQVTWQAAANAATYNVYRIGPGDTFWKVVSAKQSGTSYTDKNVTAGSTYKYTVRGVSADGKTLSPGFNNTGVSATMPKPVTRPANVTLGSAKAVSGGIQVTWQAAANAATYNVYRMGPGDTCWKVVSVKQSGTSYTDKNVTAGSTYKYTVRGVASDGKTLSPGFNNTGVSATMPKPVTAPANVTLGSAKAVNGGIQVTWQAAANAATYNVYRMGPGDTCWKVVSVKQSGTSYTDKNVTAGSTYKYTVRGVASDGKTLSPGFNNTGVSATMPKPVTAPAFVELTDAKAASGSITVTWNKADGAVKYRVYRKAEGETKWTGIANVSGTSYTDTNVQDRILYCYTVRGIAADGTLSPDYDRYGIGTTAFTKLAQGKCGENLTWTLTSDNTLTISGKGAMYDYGKSSSSGGVTPPWIAAGYRNAVSYVRIETGVTYVGQNAFADCSSITDVSFPYTLEEIGDCAFQNCTMLYSLFLPYKTVSTGNGSTITAPSVIGNAAFRGCVRLRSVYLPVTIKAIGTSAFADCFALNDVGYTGSESDWEAISIGDGNIPLTTASIRYNVIYSSPKTG